MDTLCYFLQMIKQNSVLFSILSVGNFAQIDLSKYEYQIDPIDNLLSIKNFRLNVTDIFEEVEVSLKNDYYIVTLYTKSPKYFDKEDFYFDKATTYTDKLHTLIKRQDQEITKYFLYEKEYDIVHVPFSRMPYAIIKTEKIEQKNTICIQFLNKKRGQYELEVLDKLKKQFLSGSPFRIDTKYIKEEEGEGKITGAIIDDKSHRNIK